ncbi:MAG: glycosyltransferase family 2 protein [Blastocatellales bacterium]
MKENVFALNDFPAFIFLTIFCGIAIIYFSAYWFSFNDLLTHPFSFSLLTLIIFTRIANSQAKWFTLPFMKKPLPVDPAKGLRVGVVTTIVPWAESLEMLEKTLRAMIVMDYPHDTWVLDEGDDERVKELCDRLGVFHFSRKNIPEYQTGSGIFQSHTKHGNYNAWFFEIGFKQYDVITTFDPDHVPIPAFLLNVIGYFKDSAVGYVQAAQVYYNQQASFIAQGAAEETYEYYSCTQMAAGSLGQPAMVGCHNTHRVTALKSIGGFAAHDADDLLTGLRYQSAGWKGIYLPRILAKGLTPVDWNGYLTQQRRWARSVIDVKFKLRNLVDGVLPRHGWAINFLHGLFYIQNSITTFIGILLLVYMLASGSVPQAIRPSLLPRLALLFAAIQACALFRQKFYLHPQSEHGIHWRAALLRYAKWPVFLLALRDVVIGRRVPYALTRKIKEKPSARLLIIPHSACVFFVTLAFVTGKALGHSVPSLLYWVAGGVVITSVSLIFSTKLNYPPPYE